MPTVRSLARRGTTFTRAYSETPVCYSARANFLRGQSSARTQIVDWFGADVTAAISAGRWNHDETFASWIANESLMVGKYLNTSEEFIPQPAGWDRWVQPSDGHAHFVTSINDGAGYDAQSPPVWHIDLAVNAILDLIDTATGDWLAYWPTNAPHSPHAANPDDLHSWSHVDPIVYPQTGTDWPAWIEALPQIVNWSESRRIRRAMIREAYLADQALAQILAAVEAAGETSNTMVIVSSDNGAHHGDHRIIGSAAKNTLYEPACAIPMVCAGPGFPENTVIDVLVNLQDITATITAATGSTAPHVLDGLDLRAIATDPDTYADRVLLGQRKPIGADGIPASDWIITPTRKLAHHDTTGDDEYEMYDLDSDPGELINVADDAGRLTERNALEAALETLLSISPAFSPSDLSNLRAWYDASQLTGLVNNDAVTAWEDLSVNNLDLARAGTGSDITYHTGVLNGLPVVRFPGGTVRLQVTASLSPTTGEWSAFAVFMRTGTTSIRNVVDADHTNGATARMAQAIRCNALTVESVAFNVGSSAFTDAAGTAISASTFLCASAVRGASAVEARVNGSSNGSTATTSTPALGSAAVLGVGGSGRGLGLVGDIAEVIVYSRALDSTERAQVEEYLATKWGL